jgi:hypothetical protein
MPMKSAGSKHIFPGIGRQVRTKETSGREGPYRSPFCEQAVRAVDTTAADSHAARWEVRPWSLMTNVSRRPSARSREGSLVKAAVLQGGGSAPLHMKKRWNESGRMHHHRLSDLSLSKGMPSLAQIHRARGMPVGRPHGSPQGESGPAVRVLRGNRADPSRSRAKAHGSVGPR